MSREVPSVMGEDQAMFARVRDILESARTRVARTVNSTQVIANWLIGREIVEHEQCGSHRADYGKQLVAQLSKKLTASYGRGWSAQNLFYMKQFYQCYPRLMDQDDILHALRGKSSHAEILHAASGIFETSSMTSSTWKSGELHAGLSWTHYRTLLREKRLEARSFYELEAANNAWTVRELERQMNSCLYDRLTKSRDKKALLKLANEGFNPMRPIDVMKDPVVLEFLDIPEPSKLVESDLEEALISNLQTFLLELGKGFAFVSRQERITLDGDHFYIDLVFYHTILKCR